MGSKLSLEKIYNKRFFARRHKLHWRAKPIVDALWKLWNFSSLVDVGCATGDIVLECESRGIIALGIEGSSEAEPFIVCKNYLIKDLRDPDPFYSMRYDLCLCLEVAEHIEPEYSEIFVKHLVSLSDVVVLSAAPPGQGGTGHVNCQPESYWKYKFRIHKYLKNSLATELLKKELEPWKSKPGIKAYYYNLIVFDKR